MRNALWFGSLLLAAGCIPNEGVVAPITAELTLPADLDIAWVEAANGLDDGLGTLAILDFQVYDSESPTLMPMPDIRVEVMSTWNYAYLIPAGAVAAVDYPVDRESEACDPDAWDPETCPWQDVVTGEYYELGSTYGHDYKPNYFIGPTDRYGRLRTYVYIDALPLTGGDGGGFEDFTIWASIGHQAGVVTFSAAGGG